MSSEIPGLKAVQALRHRGGEAKSVDDVVADECPVALVFNGISHAVMMATPADLQEFALGFALSEGVIADAKEVFDIEIQRHDTGIEVQLQIAQSSFVDLKQQRRTLAGRTGCGVCGIESLQLLDLAPEPVTTVSRINPDPALIQRILADLPQHQSLMQATGGAHAAAWCAADGQIVRVFEDVGRHNALDKLIGWMARESIDPAQGLVFMTSRASYELIRKAARRNIPVLATISAPTSLAIRLAQQAGIRLLSFCRQNGYVEYPD